MKRLLLSVVFTLYLFSYAVADANVLEFGAVPNDNLDDTAAFQKAINSITSDSSKGGPLIIPSGYFNISDTLTISKSTGFEIRGAGGSTRSPSLGWERRMDGTRLWWSGSEDKPVFEIIGVTGLKMSGINIQGKYKTPAVGVQLTYIPGYGALDYLFEFCTFVDCKIGIRCANSISEHTTANITYDSCVWFKNENCVQLVTPQSVEHVFIRPGFYFAKTGIDSIFGSNVLVLGGGSHALETLLKVHNGSANANGFKFVQFRFDGQDDLPKTRWLDFTRPQDGKYYGIFTFENCNNIKDHDTGDFPLFVIASGARVVVRDCNFLSPAPFAKLYGGRNQWAELYVENSLGGMGQGWRETMDNAILYEGDKNKTRWEIRNMGNLHNETVTLMSHNMKYPWENIQPNPTNPGNHTGQFTPEQHQLLLKLIDLQPELDKLNVEEIKKAVETIKKVKEQGLKVEGAATLPD